MQRDDILRQLDQKRLYTVAKAVQEHRNCTSDQALEFVACLLSPMYFISTYIHIYDSVTTSWIPFNLWPAQAGVIETFHTHQKVVVLKARQVGITWIALSYILWDALFNAPASALVFSKTDDDAMYLLGKERLKGMFHRLPNWLKPAVYKDDEHTLQFGYSSKEISTIRSKSTRGGDSYTNTVVLVDEADLIPNLKDLMLAVEPTIEAGGKLLLVSKPDRSNPASYFKALYKSARDGHVADGAAVFLPWHVHPARDAVWYDNLKRRYLETEGSLDGLYESYPATEVQALSPTSRNKRFMSHMIDRTYQPQKPLETALGVPETHIYKDVQPKRGYVIGVDTAEGLPHSDNSTAVVLDALSGETVAVMAGKFAPDQHARYVDILHRHYNQAPVLVERNNMGAAFILQAEMLGIVLLSGLDGRTGWNTTKSSKPLLYETLAESFRKDDILIYDSRVYGEIISIEASDLNAPAGLHDDMAIALALANYARPFGVSLGDGHVSFNARDW